MNAVAYYRYSSHGQTEQSIDGQRNKVDAFARDKGYVIMDEYIDRAQTGTSDKRTKFQKLINDSRKGNFDFVIVYALDRFGRNLRQSIEYESKLQKNGVALLSATEEFRDNPSGKLHRNIMMSFSQYYSDELSEKVSRGIAISVEKCKFIGGFIPLGFSVDEHKRYIIDPITAPVVQKIFELYVAGFSLRKINELIIEQFGKPYFGNISNSINRILDNVNYMGVYTRGGTTVPGGMPRIIDDALWERAAQMRGKKKRSPTSTRNDAEYLLTTKLFCGYHGREPENRVMMVGVSGTSKSGKIHNYYTCKSVWNKMGCGKKNVRKEYIENFILEKAREQLTDDNILYISKMIVDISRAENNTPTIADIKKQLRENAKAIDNLLVAIERGSDNLDLINERISQKRKEKEALESSLAREQYEKIEITEDDIGTFFFRLRNGDENDIKYKRALLSIFISAVYLYDDRATIFFNATDRTVEVDYNILVEPEEPSNGIISGCSYNEPTAPPNIGANASVNGEY